MALRGALKPAAHRAQGPRVREWRMAKKLRITGDYRHMAVRMITIVREWQANNYRRSAAVLGVDLRRRQPDGRPGHEVYAAL